MNNKRFMAFFITASLLLLPVTSHYAMSWEKVKEKAQKYISEENVQNLLPGAVIITGLAAVGLYYYLMSKQGGNDSGKKEEEQSAIGEDNFETEDSVGEKKVLPQQGVSLKQFQVYCQFNKDGGGAASCGYQTLLRSMQVVKAKSENENDKDLEKTLMDSDSIAIYFGPGGAWREKIIAFRKEEVLRDYLHIKLLSTLQKNCDNIVHRLYGNEAKSAYQPIIDDIADKKLTSDKARQLYASALGNLKSRMVNISKGMQQEYKPYEFTDEAICDYVAKELETLKNKINEQLINILKDPAVIKECFNLKSMRDQFLSKSFILDLPILIKKIESEKEQKDSTHFKGDWLDKDEIKFLWDEQKNEIIPTVVDCELNIIDDFSLLGHKDVDPTTFFVFETIKPILNTEKVFFAIFALGTMINAREGQVIGTRGHWYPLVMYQNQEGKREYYIMDSGSKDDTNRLKDTNAWKIINLIEQ